MDGENYILDKLRNSVFKFVKESKMGSGYTYYSFLFHALALLVLQYAYGISGREMAAKRRNNIDEHLKLYTNEDKIHEQPSSSHMAPMDPSVNVFFKVNDLYAGKKMPIYFAIKDPSITPHLLPREEAESIPFSSSKLQKLLDFFSISEDSPQAKAMKGTLGQCELQPSIGDTRFCATSIESMLDFAQGVFGSDSSFKVLTTTITRNPNPGPTALQNYTVLGEPKLVSARKIVACHTLPYPYAVFYCHAQTARTTDDRLYTILLGGENGDRVETIAACHMNTSHWDRDHIGFRVLGIVPGSAPVCHIFPADNLVWVPSPATV